MILFNKKKVPVSATTPIIADMNMEIIKKSLAYAVKVAIGHRTVLQFTKAMNMVNEKPILDIINKKYNELPNRNLLRKIANASMGQITFQHLYSICGYSESDPEEDRSWAKWVPRWGEVYMCDLGVGEDSIQGGKRNVLIIQNNKANQHSPNATILTISSKCKFNPFMHISLGKELGFELESYCLTEMPLTVSKRRFFYNKIPYKITKLPDFKMKEIQVGLEKQFGFLPLYFDEEHAFDLIKHIKLLEQNVRIKKSHNLIDILNQKMDDLKEYCSKYHKNYKILLQEYDRINNYSYNAVSI